MRVFVSYSRRDADFVDQLNRTLTDNGHDVWIDRDDIAGSGEDRWRRSIVMAIRNSETVLLVLSPESTRSTNVERELSVAAENNKRVVPILLRPCTIPDGFQYELAGVQYVDFSALEYRVALNQLLTKLTPPRPQPDRPPAPVRSPAPADRRPRSNRLVWTVAAAGVVIVVVAVIVAFTLSRSGGSTTSPPTTGPTSTPAPTAEEQARQIVADWASATTARNWPKVTEIDPEGLPDGSGHDYLKWYGSDPDQNAYMNSVQAYISNAAEQDAGMWRLTGALIAYDTEVGSPDGRTNFVCSTWDVDLTGQPPTSHWRHTNADQLSNRRLAVDDFASTYARTCAG